MVIESIMVEEMGCGCFSKHYTFVVWICILNDMLDIEDSAIIVSILGIIS